MRRAISLSRRGFPAPNPHVGCVVAKDGEIVGEGFHAYEGGPHAERVALGAAGGRACGSDVYVTLQPCNHLGRTPPCTEALIEAGVRRVFYACQDPNPVAAGGPERLRASGIEVVGGVLEAEAARNNVRFLFAMRFGRPFVVVKAAASLDGRTALQSGESKWITSERSRHAGHALRAECGAVLVGYKTVLADDPKLTARIPGVRSQPLRVVIDPDAHLTGKEAVFDDEAPTLHVTGRPIDLNALLLRLRADGQTGLLVEGGARTIGEFFAAELVDAVELFVAPKLLGSGPAWLEGLNVPGLDAAPALSIGRMSRVAPDLRISALPARTVERLSELGLRSSDIQSYRFP